MSIRKYKDYKPSVYEYDDNLNLRFVLGNYGSNTLICAGINPNTANAEVSDPTMNDLIKFSKEQGYDGCIMINPYPLICNKPDNLPAKFDKEICRKNISYISSVFERCKGGTLLLSWGDYISRNNDFKEQANIIIEKAKENNIRMIHINSLTKCGNPKHFRYLNRTKDFRTGNYTVHEIKY